MMQTATDESAKTIPDNRNSAKYFEISALIAASIAVWWQPIASTLRLALGSDAYTHILLILPLSAALIYFERGEVLCRPPSKRWVGWAILSAALLVRACTAAIVNFGTTDVILSFSVFGLVLWWIGSVILCFGVETFHSLLFPLCFLFLVVPVPNELVNWMTQTLQYQSALGATLLFRIAQVPVTRDGLILSIPGLDLEVAPECSSIRSSTMLIVITLVLAHLFLRSRWRKIVLLAASLPLAVVKNAVRIFTIGQLGTRVDPAYLNGRLHRHGGIVFLAMAVMIVIVLSLVLRQSELRDLHPVRSRDGVS